MLKVFISYSRRDLEFTEQLCAALEALGYVITIDRKGIHGAERWEDRLGQLIRESDSILFVLTPTSASSEVCRWELEQALSQRKRVLPVLAAPLGDVQPHTALRDLNYIHCYPEASVPGSGWGHGLARLHAALSVDIEWIREHTRVAEISRRWQISEAPDLLARGAELDGLQRWRDRRPANAPELTDAQRSFLQASELAEAQRKDAERQQLERISAAQQEREQALQEGAKAQEERAGALRLVARRTMIGGGAAVILALTAGGAAFVAHQNSVQLQQQLSRNEEERLLQDRLLHLTRQREHPPKPFSDEMLARDYEGETPDHVGTDFAGGIYYGTYRIQASTQMQAFLDFLDRWESGYSSRLTSAGGVEAARQRGSDFVKAWQSLARDPASAARFAKLQTDFVTQNSFGRLAGQLAARLGLHLEQRSQALRAVIFSIAVQYGPSTTLVHDALTGLGDLSRQDDEALIQRLFEYRNKVEKYFPGIQERSPNFAALIRERNRRELNDALFILRHSSS
ncbi:TIR domain-containing protein [Zoogloea sp. LCSB751]|uniref:TIR domain-containing protein n=1 Tax=Zoogloea sp. LCSB751 TaxID=1965277 RepID=UPI0013747EA5|nr:TIR domain-containing protein [Zoogloea sp. LCSB751]